MNRVALFVVALFVIQRLEGTAFYFSLGCAVFLLVAAFAFNEAGGLTRASGAYVFCYTVLVVLIGICYKAFLGEPAESNLQDPGTTIGAYVASIAAMFAAVIVSRRFSRKSGLLQHLLKESDMYRASVGSMAFGIAGAFIIALLGQSGAKLETAFAQLNLLIPLGIIIGVMYEIRRSDGTRSTNMAVIVGAAYYFLLGLTGFSKQGMLMPFYCWVLPVCALRYRLSLWQVAASLLALFVMFHYLVPFSQYGRTLAPEYATLEQRIDIALPLLEHPERTRQLYLEGVSNELNSVEKWGGYYNEPQGFWDRLQFVSVDDSLIYFTNQGHVFGLMPVEAEILNAIPRVFWPDKPPLNFGNAYAHEMGGLSAEDTSTGIAFSPTSEAYHMAKWTGILIIAPLTWFLLFVLYDSLFGDLTASPWGLLVMAQISHVAPEGALSGLIYQMTYGTAALIFCAFFAARIAPLLAIGVLGPGRKRTPDLQPRILSATVPFKNSAQQTSTGPS